MTREFGVPFLLFARNQHFPIGNKNLKSFFQNSRFSQFFFRISLFKIQLILLCGLQVIPYWGSQNDRKVLRAFWNPKHLYTPDASCHVLITSYGFAVKDVKHLQRIKWQYMVLDEAQALKSASSQRWKTLLSYNSRNR